jgi:hypothetical protein
MHQSRIENNNGSKRNFSLKHRSPIENNNGSIQRVENMHRSPTENNNVSKWNFSLKHRSPIRNDNGSIQRVENIDQSPIENNNGAKRNFSLKHRSPIRNDNRSIQRVQDSGQNSAEIVTRKQKRNRLRNKSRKKKQKEISKENMEIKKEIRKVHHIPTVTIESNVLPKLIDNNYVLNEKNEKIYLHTVFRTNQKIATESIAKLVSIQLPGPSPSSTIPTRQDIILQTTETKHNAHIVWIPTALTQNITQLTKSLLICLERPLSRISKKNANGTCIEFGIGCGAGKQSTSINICDEKINLSYVRKDENFVKHMDVLYTPIEEELTKVLVEYFPDLFSQEEILEGYNLGDVGKCTIAGMCMEKNGLPYLQRALRVNGYKNDDSLRRKELAKEGGAPNHRDTCDYPVEKGSIIIYLNPFDGEFNGTDLILFNEPNGGRGVRIPTMMSGWITVVLLPSSHCLHGSVFPDVPYSLDQLSKPGIHALRVVLYTLKESVKLAAMIEKDQETMDKWKQAICDLNDQYRWRHVWVYNNVCDVLHDQFCSKFDKLNLDNHKFI